MSSSKPSKKVKNHKCGICSKSFTCDRIKTRHYKTCYPTKTLGLPSLEELRTSINSPFQPILLASTPGGNAVQWTIRFPAGTVEPYESLKDAAQAMKSTIFEHSYMHTYQLKFDFAVCIVLSKATTVYPLAPVLRSDPVRVFLADLFNIDEILMKQVNQLMEKISEYEIEWLIDNLLCLDTNIISIDPLNAFPDLVW